MKKQTQRPRVSEALGCWRPEAATALLTPGVFPAGVFNRQENDFVDLKCGSFQAYGSHSHAEFLLTVVMPRNGVSCEGALQVGV